MSYTMTIYFGKERILKIREAQCNNNFPVSEICQDAIDEKLKEVLGED